MGRGSSKAGGGSGGYKYVKNLKLPSGEEIDLTSIPLKYGEKDKALSQNARTVIEDFENKRYKNKIEYSRLIDKDGNIIEDNKGGKGSVKASFNARLTADVLTHNHPRDEGIIGGTFSTGDLHNFNRFNQTTYRATAKEGTYSISKTPNYDAKGLMSALNSFDTESNKKADRKRKEITEGVKAGKITYSDIGKTYKTLNNELLIDRHNFLLNNQKKYGYTYTLEER